MNTTVIYYTANRITDFFHINIRRKLLDLCDGIPIISVSHKPIDLGFNICVGDIGCSAYNVYKQILIGAKEAKTKYVACCEDDCLYNREHLTFEPEEYAFYYNHSRWMLEGDGRFRYRHRTGMHTCIVQTELMIKTLEIRFNKYPIPLFERNSLKGWGEPGRYEKNLRLPPVRMESFTTVDPVITFNHKPCLGGLRRTAPTDIIKTELEPWGNAKKLWDDIHG